MKNKAIISFIFIFAMILGSYSVLATKDINVTPDSINITGFGILYMPTFFIQNIGTEAVNVTLSVLNPLVGPGGRTIDMTNLNVMPSQINPGNMAFAQFTVSLSNAVVGQYVGLLKAQVVGDVESATVVVTANVIDNGQSFVVFSPAMNATQSDTTVYQTVKVQNNANKDLSVIISKEGFDGMTSSLDKMNTQTLPALSTMNIVSSVQIPANKAIGTYTGTVNVTDASTLVSKTANLAVNVLPTYKVSISAVTVSDIDPGQTKSQAFNIQNKGNMPLSGLSLANISMNDNDGDRINVSFSPSQDINVSVDSSASVTATLMTSEKMDPGAYSQLVTVSGSGVSQTFTFSAVINSLLKVTDVNVDPDSVMPGEMVEVEVTVENTADDIDMTGVEVEAFIMDGNDVLQDENDDDMKDTISVGKLNNGDEEKMVFKFKMPYTAKDGDSFGVKVEAKGKNADDHTEKYNDTYTDDNIIDINRPDDKVEIYKASLDSSTLSCIKTTYIEVGLKDIGDNDEQVILTVKNDQLGMRVQDNFDMSSDYDDDNFDVSKSYLLDFSSAPVGTYPISIIAENDNGDSLGTDTISVNVQDCVAGSYTPPTTTGTGGTTSSGTSGTTTGTVTQPVELKYASGTPENLLGATVPAVSASPVISRVKKGTWTDNPLFIAILVLANLLLVVLIIAAIMYLIGSGKSKKTMF